MSLEMVKTKLSILKNGGKLGSYKRITELGVNKSPTADTWHDIVYRMSSDVEVDFNEEIIYGEGGEPQNTVYGNVVARLTIKASQLDAALINFLLSGGEDEWFMILFDCGKGAANKKLELLIPYCKFKKGTKFSLPGRNPEIIINIYDNVALTTITDKPSWAVGAVTDYAIGAGEYVKAYEITPA